MSTKPVATPLHEGDYWKASNSLIAAFKTSPFTLYLEADAKPLPPWKVKAFHLALLACYHRNMIIYVVEGGASICITEPNPTAPKTIMARLKDRWAKWLLTLAGIGRTAEQKKRYAELASKSQPVVEEVLGDRRQEMFYVSLLATDPRYQGKGFASAALRAVTTLADSQGRACWLYSGDIRNQGFYNGLGFRTVATFFMGDDNPEWREHPIPVQVMVREPGTPLEISSSAKVKTAETANLLV